MKSFGDRFTYIIIVAQVAMIPFFFTNCSGITLIKASETYNASSKSEFCLAEPEEIERYVKFLFIIDKSGSNNDTDPGAVRRAGNIENFYLATQNGPDADYYQWGLIAFRDAPTEAYIGGPLSPIFTQDQGIVLGAIDRLRTDPDNGGTPYAAALSLAEVAIQNDVQAFPEQDNQYMIFFISDGVPTDVTDNQQLRNAVADVMDVKPGYVFLSSGYYNAGGDDLVAIDRLQNMADEGNGKFVNFGTDMNFNFDGLVVAGPNKQPYQMKNFLVYNLNSSICEDGRYDTDSDGDAVCDRDEIRYGLDPTKRFSFSDGFGDYFHWRNIKYGEILPPCTDRSDDDHDLLTKCEEEYIFNPNPQGTTHVSGDIDDPDTDWDGFIDGIETFSFKTQLGSPMNAFDVLRSHDFEPENAGVQIQQHRNPNVYDPNAFKYDSIIIPTGINDEGQACYRFTQTKLELKPVLAVTDAQNNFPEMLHQAQENVVLVYYIQTPQNNPDSAGVYRYSFQKIMNDPVYLELYGDNAGVSMHDSKFKTYIVPDDNN